MSRFDPPGTCPEIVSSATLAFSPFILLEIVILLPVVIGLQALFGWDDRTAFNFAVGVHVVVLPLFFVAGVWHAYVYIPRKWKEDYDRRNMP